MQAERINRLPKWKRGDLTDRLKNHMLAESVFERRIGDTLQVVERLVPRHRPTQDARPFYRLLEVRNDRAHAVCVTDTQRDARAAADKRVPSQQERKG